MKSEDKNTGVKAVLQIFIQVTGEHSSKEAVKIKCTHERKIQKAQCRNTKAEGSGACIAIRRPRKKRKKKSHRPFRSQSLWFYSFSFKEFRML